MTDHYCISSTGGRTMNEDCAITFVSGGVRGFVVCDGVGGCRHGDIASRTVCEEFRRAFLAPEGGIDDRIEAGMTAAENALRALQQQAGDSKAYKSTIAALLLAGEDVYIVHVGDSRVYHFADGEYIWRTADHSLAQMMVMTGDIEPDAIRECEDRNVLLHAVGAASDTFRYQKTVRKLRGERYDAFVVCTDGFWQYVPGERMAAFLGYGKLNIPEFDARVWMELMASGVENSEGDNYTAIAVIQEGE